MAIYFYEQGDLASGFVGYRVVKNANVSSEDPAYKQRWFSINDMMSNVAEAKAQELEDLWCAEVESMRAMRQIKPGGVRACKGIPVATNLQLCYYKTVRGYRVGFRITFGVGKQQLFALKKEGYQVTINSVLEIYANHFGLNKAQREAYLMLFPTPKDIIKHICTRFHNHYKHASAVQTLKLFKSALSKEELCLQTI